MSIIRNILTGNPYDLAQGLDTLRERAYRECLAESERMNLHASAAMSNLDEYEAYVPEPSEVATWLTKDHIGDWQEVLRVTAILVTRFALESEVDSDVATIERAIHEGTLNGFNAIKLYATNAHAWNPNFRELDWVTGTLHLWRFSDGTIDAGILEVELADVATIWVDLASVN